MTVESYIRIRSVTDRAFGALTGLPPFAFECGLMKCPTCAENTPDAWLALNTEVLSNAFSRQRKARLDGINIAWMQCANSNCRQTVIQFHEVTFQGSDLPVRHVETWTIYPRYATHSKPLDANVKEPYRTDYGEAIAVLNMSPRLSAVMSRRILADLLKEFAHLKQHSLAARIDAFNQDTMRPFDLRQNLHYLREIGDFVAHAIEDDQANIVNVDMIEAEWTLDVIERLFDYFIVTPARDRDMRAKMDERLKTTENGGLGG